MRLKAVYNAIMQIACTNVQPTFVCTRIIRLESEIILTAYNHTRTNIVNRNVSLLITQPIIMKLCTFFLKIFRTDVGDFGHNIKINLNKPNHV